MATIITFPPVGAESNKSARWALPAIFLFLVFGISVFVWTLSTTPRRVAPASLDRNAPITDMALVAL